MTVLAGSNRYLLKDIYTRGEDGDRWTHKKSTNFRLVPVPYMGRPQRERFGIILVNDPSYTSYFWSFQFIYLDVIFGEIPVESTDPHNYHKTRATLSLLPSPLSTNWLSWLSHRHGRRCLSLLFLNYTSPLFKWPVETELWLWSQI